MLLRARGGPASPAREVEGDRQAELAAAGDQAIEVGERAELGWTALWPPSGAPIAHGLRDRPAVKALSRPLRWWCRSDGWAGGTPRRSRGRRSRGSSSRHAVETLRRNAGTTRTRHRTPRPPASAPLNGQTEPPERRRSRTRRHPSTRCGQGGLDDRGGRFRGSFTVGELHVELRLPRPRTFQAQLVVPRPRPRRSTGSDTRTPRRPRSLHPRGRRETGRVPSGTDSIIGTAGSLGPRRTTRYRNSGRAPPGDHRARRALHLDGPRPQLA